MLHRLALRSRDRRERARPEDLAQHGGILEQALLVVDERVEARGDDPLHRLRERIADAAALRQHPRELLRIERIPAGSQQQLGLCLRRQDRTVEQRGEQLRRLVGGERRQRDRRRVALAASPARSAVEELRTRRAEHEERCVLDPLGQLVDEVEQLVAGPVQVLEDEDERAMLGERLEKASPRRERLLPRATDVLVASQTHERAQLPFDPRPLGLHDVLHDRLAQLPRHILGSIALEDSRLRLHHLAERPERGALAVRQRASVLPEDDLL